MDRKEKEARCCAAGRDETGKLVNRCKVYSRWLVHGDTYRCPDCSFATESRLNNKPVWRI